MIPLDEIFSLFGERTFHLQAGKATTFRQLACRVEDHRKNLEGSGIPPNKVVCLEPGWSVDSIARLLACFSSGHNVHFGSPAPAHGWEPFLEWAPLLVLKTGGSTGSPRHVVHSVERLCRSYLVREKEPRRQLVLYAADHIAGLDSLLQVLFAGGALVVPADKSPQSIAEAIVTDRVEVLPATPTMLQFLLLSEALQGRDVGSVRVIPHGAERMPPSLRKRVQAAFPNAVTKQRFGLTELGSLPVREDPYDPEAIFLEEKPGYQWRVVDGELLIRCPTRYLGTLEKGPDLPAADGWFHTGDLVELTPHGSVRILGRRQFQINVGGIKVLPEEVEALLLEHPQVRAAAVTAIPNPLTGETVEAQVICHGEVDLLELARAVRQSACRRNLPLAYVPTRIKAVDHLEKTESGKRLRSGQNT